MQTVEEKSVTRKQVESNNYATPTEPKKTGGFPLDRVIIALSLIGCAAVVGFANRPKPTEATGIKYLQEGNYPQAVSTLQKAVQTEGPSHASYLAMAKASNEMQNYSSGLKYADEALKYFPTEPAAWVERSTANLGLHKFQEAFEDSQHALGFDATNKRALAVRNRAETMLAQNNSSLEASRSYNQE
jgi:tetratricopeptide (TPR) repeat protein